MVVVTAFDLLFGHQTREAVGLDVLDIDHGIAAKRHELRLGQVPQGVIVMGIA